MITLFVCLLFVEGYVAFERTGENFFHVFVNGVQVGTVGEAETAEKLLIKARKNVAAQTKKLLRFQSSELRLSLFLPAVF